MGDEKLKFTTLQDSEQFKGYCGDIDRVAPKKDSDEFVINRYGVKVRKSKTKTLPNDDDIEAVEFSVNKG